MILSERLQAGLLSTLMARNGLLQLTLSIEADAQLRESVFGALNQNVEHGEVVVLCAPALRNALARWVQGDTIEHCRLCCRQRLRTYVTFN